MTKQITDKQVITFDQMVESVCQTVKSSSASTYKLVLNLWNEWCQTQGYNPLEIEPSYVYEFLKSRKVVRRTRQKDLAILRSLAKLIAIYNYQDELNQRRYEALKLIRIPDQNLHEERRYRQSLPPDSVKLILACWQGTRLVAVRNRAILAVLFYTGLRRAEVANLQWQDIDFENGTLQVLHGKGDKTRQVTIIADELDTALQYLHEWYQLQLQLTAETRRFVFCPLLCGVTFGLDKALAVRTLHSVIERTRKQTGIYFNAHDARRTVATQLLMNNTPLHEVSAQLGHADASTTMMYAYAPDARQRRRHFKTGY